MKITSVEISDVRYPTSRLLDGSDAVHTHPDYSCAYIILKTDTDLEGHGFTFTLGRGNEVVALCMKSLCDLHVVNRNFDTEIWGNMMSRDPANRGFYYRLTQDGQMRWIGPEKGVLALAACAILNAVWDLRARQVGKPLWRYLTDMAPAELVELIDFQHITDFVTREEAVALLTERMKGKDERIQEMLTKGFPAYTTSAGWLGYSEEKIRALCREYLAQGHRYFKMKVGSVVHQEDIVRARAIREEIDKYPNTYLMMDANQKWSVDEAIACMKDLAVFKPLWIEEPTNCDDVMGHKAIADALDAMNSGVGVATGEMCQSKVMFKQFIRSGGMKYCQIDSCRVSGISEVLATLLMAAKAKVKVCPHAGGVGLCEYVRHLVMVDYCVFNPVHEFDRVCEYASHLHEHFEDPIGLHVVDDKMFYVAAAAPGYAKMHASSIKEYRYPSGTMWAGESTSGPSTKGGCPFHAGASSGSKAKGTPTCVKLTALALFVGAITFAWSAGRRSK